MPKVCNVFCLVCNARLSVRGKQTYLIADRVTNVISTDFKTSAMGETKEIETFDKCECKIRRITCISCESLVGHHVVSPCQNCNNCNNTHYYIFVRARAQQTQTEWSNLSPIYKQQQAEKQTLVECEWPQELQCSICMQKMTQPTVIACGHTFCRTCIQRHVDLRENCPLDKTSISRQGPFIPNRLAEELISNLQHKKKLEQAQNS